MMAVRRATSDDVAELIRLRELLMDRMAAERGAAPDGTGWQEAFGSAIRERLADDSMAVFVVPADAGSDTDGDTDGGLAACGIGIIERAPPNAYVPDGRRGYLLGMVTDPAHRRRGYADAIVVALLEWFRGRGVHLVELHATSDAERLYRRHGFTDPADPVLSWRP